MLGGRGRVGRVRPPASRMDDDRDSSQLARALDESERRYRETFDTNPAVKLVIDPESGQLIDANSAACRFYGYSREALLALRIQDINTLPDHVVKEEMQRAREEQRLFFKFRHLAARGVVKDVEVYSGPMTWHGRQVLHSIIIDVSDRHRLEEQLVRAQRMEAIGQLAGGIAHDFNNILTVILGSSEAARRSLPTDSPAAAHVAEIAGAALQAAEITQQLLTLARKHVAASEVVDLNTLVLRTDRMLRRLIGENIELVTVPDPELWAVLLDPARFQQLLVNLVVNARDAMPAGGRLTLTTENHLVQPEDEHSARLGARVVRLAVEDTGCGIEPAILERIFEPLFTTKEHLGSSGLGLATCQNIVEQAGGVLLVESTPGRGSRFEVLLPAVDASALSRPVAPAMPTGPTEGTVLVVEDEPAVRRLVSGTLAEAGYRVLTAQNGDEALRVAREAEVPIDLLLTDVVMPLIGGTELAQRLRRSHPTLPVIFMSGYPGNFDETILSSESAEFLAKPFSSHQLLAKVGQTLARAVLARRGADS